MPSWFWFTSLTVASTAFLAATPLGPAVRSVLDRFIGWPLAFSTSSTSHDIPLTSFHHPLYLYLLIALPVAFLSSILISSFVSFFSFLPLLAGRRVRRLQSRQVDDYRHQRDVDLAAVHTSCSLPSRSQATRIRMATYGPPYPNGWYKVADSHELKPGDVRRVNCVGLQLVVFRGKDDGQIGLLDAYCPHMGADLSVGGEVVGDCIQCPFHKWQFNAEGKCTVIPYAEKVPDFARAQSYVVVEHHNMVMFYYDAEGRKPHYELPIVPEIAEGSFVYRGRYDRDVKMHIVEFAENTPDFQHFEPLHSCMIIPFTSIRIPFIRIVHEAGWSPDEKLKHVAYFTDKANLAFRGKDLPRTNASALITFVGPGSFVMFRFKTDLGEIHLFQTHTPVEPLLQKVCFQWYAEKSIPRILVSYVVGNWISQWANDVDVWENKKFAVKPILVKEDGPIKQLRRWYSQFISEHSLTMAEATAGSAESRNVTTNLDW